MKGLGESGLGRGRWREKGSRREWGKGEEGFRGVRGLMDGDNEAIDVAYVYIIAIS